MHMHVTKRCTECYCLTRLTTHFLDPLFYSINKAKKQMIHYTAGVKRYDDDYDVYFNQNVLFSYVFGINLVKVFFETGIVKITSKYVYIMNEQKTQHIC